MDICFHISLSSAVHLISGYVLLVESTLSCNAIHVCMCRPRDLLSSTFPQ